VDAIRGVDSTSTIRKLVAKGFIKEAGRSELPGRPILYETTHEFLDYFGLSSIEDLPNIDDILETVNEEDNDNKDLYESKYVEEEE
jgi:segregation and condensation protein B